MNKIKSLLTWSNAGTAAFALLAIMVLVSPQAKVWVISGIIKTGIMKPPTKNDSSAGDKPVTPAPSLILRSAEGEKINTAQQKGKVLILNFWATWCPPCIAEMPSINEMYKRYQNNPNVLILSVDVDNNFQKSVTFMQRNKYILPVYNVYDNLPQQFMSGSIPTTVIIDKTGAIVARHEGAANFTDKHFYKYIDELAANK